MQSHFGAKALKADKTYYTGGGSRCITIGPKAWRKNSKCFLDNEIREGLELFGGFPTRGKRKVLPSSTMV